MTDMAILTFRRPDFIARQGARPHGLLGQLIARIMARETAADNKQAVALLGLKEDDRVLDVGTGHGRSLGLIARLAPSGVAVGIDTSEVALGIARACNRVLIRAGRVSVLRARSDALPAFDLPFDKAMAVHTLYFWRPAEPHLREIARVLRPNGKFVLGFRPAEDKAVTRQFPDSIYTFRTIPQVEALLAKTGFRICRTIKRETQGHSMVWIGARRSPHTGEGAGAHQAR
jgi:ubiquinone/menaquinone biosynthesis C-methylase UbiE